jgi:hypothetical protein
MPSWMALPRPTHLQLLYRCLGHISAVHLHKPKPSAEALLLAFTLALGSWGLALGNTRTQQPPTQGGDDLRDNKQPEMERGQYDAIISCLLNTQHA